ncbi:DNA-binding transcriptional LysR family regulator [Bradyrhizobium sp. cir1]|uniref:LysR substrate-binding domain-containing protein n=1 Tax=Bradyrhizobium sp. cir1 TaxID=1445730 RepID=UPI001605E923|nr:LysR substrate-binding domain-containing protein [Bradyrhizobium sp. cir1]MBB4368297.1 DNA-binding transcriptional LysR family regulator [Bradyrhizobium sp. cir1]
MPRAINLRQIEIFKALIEHGTVSRAAEVLNISQPAASKLLMHLESDTGLKLFDRYKGRLAPTAQSLRLYEEIDRIFSGVRQVESAIAHIRREDQGKLVIGTIPGLGGAFIQRTTMNFLKCNPKVYCSVQSLTSQWIAEYVLTRKLDVGLVSARIDNPHLVTDSLLEHPLLCIMPIGHALSRFPVIHPEHLNDIPFISFNRDSYTGQKIAGIFEKYRVHTNVVLTADMNPTVCRFVSAGLGISLVHPLFLAGMEEHLVARPFEPETPMDFLLCYGRDVRNLDLISNFVEETKATAARLIAELGAVERKPTPLARKTAPSPLR